MNCVVHHAYFFPWLGYFSKLNFAENFILLDDAFFSKGFYHDRTKYVNSRGEVKWLTVPVGQNFKKASHTVLLRDKAFLEIFIKTIEQSYAKANHFKSEWPELKALLSQAVASSDTLFELNVNIIKSIILMLDIRQPNFIYSSELPVHANLDKTEKLVAMCKAVNCDELIVGDGNGLIEHDVTIIENAGIHIYLQSFYANHPVYFQIRRQRLGFEKGLSVLDAILNIGLHQTSQIIKNPILKPKLISLNHDK